MTLSKALIPFLLCILAPAAFAQYYDFDPDDPGDMAPIREGE